MKRAFLLLGVPLAFAWAFCAAGAFMLRPAVDAFCRTAAWLEDET